jgi:excisionase family DNA binding protein
MTEELLPVAEVAALLKLNPQTIYNKINDGSLPSTKIGRGRRIRRSEIEFLAGGEGSEEVDLLTIAEVADLPRMNQQTIRNWVDAGTLKAVRIGRRVRVSRLDINAVIEAGNLEPCQPQPPTAEDFWIGNQPVGEPQTQAAAGDTGKARPPE